MSEHHPPVSQSLTNIRLPKPLLVIFFLIKNLVIKTEYGLDFACTKVFGLELILFWVFGLDFILFRIILFW